MNIAATKGELFSKKNSFAKIKDVKTILRYGDLTKCKSPRVAVIMPVYNRPHFFMKSLASVVNQDYEATYEIIVVDNYDKGAESPNEEIVKNLNRENIFYYHNEKNIGLNGSCNRGIELSRAEYVTFCHDDDMFFPWTLSRLMALQKKAGDKCIISKYVTIDTNDAVIIPTNFPRLKNGGHLIEKDHVNYFLFDQFLASGGLLIASLFKRKNLIEIGGFNEDFEPVSDYALQTAYTYFYGCVMNNLPSFQYRVGINASMHLYQQFADAQKNIQMEILKKMWLPNFILKPIIKTRYNIVRIHSEITFGNASPNKWNELSKKDIFIKKVCHIYEKFKTFKINNHKTSPPRNKHMLLP